MSETACGLRADAAETDRASSASGVRTTRRGVVALGAGLLGLAAAPGAALASPFVMPMAPRATHVVVSKKNRVMELRERGEVLRRYRVDLGFQPLGHKFASGDGRTPEGRYWIDRRNPRSEFFLSLGISYPNVEDVARARARGLNPGGDIFIHGEPVRDRKSVERDWTAGCIAVTNAEMEEVWALTPTGVPITIFA